MGALACTTGTVFTVSSPTPEESSVPGPATSVEPVPGASSDAPNDPARHAALQADALDVMQAYANRSARWSPDHRTVVFLSNRNRGWGAYLSGWLALDLPPRGVPSPDGAVVDAAFCPRGVVLVTETSGKRNFSFFQPESGLSQPWGPNNLTVASAPLKVASVPNAVAVIAKEQVFLGSFDTPVRHVIPVDGRARVCDLSPDGRRILLIDQPATAQARIVEVDRDGRRLERFESSDARPVDLAIYAPDGETVLFASNKSGEPARIFRRGKRPGPPVQVFQAQDARARIVGLTGWSRSLRVGVLTESAAAREVFLVQPSGHGQPTRIKLPPGVGTLDSFSPNGRVLTITWETPEGPSDIWEVSTGRGAALRKLRDDIRPALARLEPLRWRQVEISEASFSASVYEPASSNPPLGALLLLGEKGHAASWRPAIRFLVGIGFVVIEPVDTPSSVEQVGKWMSLLETWVPAQGWSARMAVVARSPVSHLVLDAAGGAKHPWAVVVNPPARAWEVRGTWTGRNVLVAGDAKVDATKRVTSLRSAGATVEHAVCDPAGCWAREAQFLERLFRGSAKGDG
jgi:hypothetical protein